MSVSAGYLDWLRESLAPLGAITVRRMFGGAGVQVDGHMIGIVVDDTLWFKVDDGNRAEFETRNLPRFHYERLGKTVAMNFYQPPEEALESPPELLRWARSAFSAALRSGQVARRTRQRRRTP
jgi:DNA transformation protein